MGLIRRKRRGFTLVELVIIIMAVIIILAVIAGIVAGVHFAWKHW